MKIKTQNKSDMNEKDTKYPLVSIITINYNQSAVTVDLLKSLRNITYPNIEIIVVDNASPSDNPDALKESFPEITLIKSPENLGFAGGNNLGIRRAKGEYFLLLNNDTEVAPGFLEPLIQKFRDNPKIGAVSPKIYFHHTPKMLQFTGISPINNITIRNTGWGFGKMDEGQFDEDRESFFAHGAAMMAPRKVIEEVGLMAEIFFLYYEEMDWGQRIRNAGYKIFYVHNSVIYHKESVSTGKLSPLKIYYMNRARIIYMRRNVSGFSHLLAFLYLCFAAFPKNVIMFLFTGKFVLLRAFLRAMFWNVRNSLNKEIFANPMLND
jgi:GT2 family glycosyltransferase